MGSRDGRLHQTKVRFKLSLSLSLLFLSIFSCLPCPNLYYPPPPLSLSLSIFFLFFHPPNYFSLLCHIYSHNPIPHTLSLSLSCSLALSLPLSLFSSVHLFPVSCPFLYDLHLSLHLFLNFVHSPDFSLSLSLSLVWTFLN